MSDFKELNDRNAILKAIAEYDDLGQQTFLKHYGFGKARKFVLLYEG